MQVLEIDDCKMRKTWYEYVIDRYRGRWAKMQRWLLYFRLSGSICLGTRLDCAAGTTWTTLSTLVRVYKPQSSFRCQWVNDFYVFECIKMGSLLGKIHSEDLIFLSEQVATLDWSITTTPSFSSSSQLHMCSVTRPSNAALPHFACVLLVWNVLWQLSCPKVLACRFQIRIFFDLSSLNCSRQHSTICLRPSWINTAFL